MRRLAHALLALPLLQAALACAESGPVDPAGFPHYIPPLTENSELSLDSPGGARFIEGLRLLEGSGTGRPLVQIARDQGLHWTVSDRLLYFMAFFPEDNGIMLGGQWLDEHGPADRASAFGHELEHLRQNGFTGPLKQTPLELEWAALSTQARVWRELGAPISEKEMRDLPVSVSDMILYLEHPAAARLQDRILRHGECPPLDEMSLESLSPTQASSVKDYLALAGKEEEAWREKWGGLPERHKPLVMRAFDTAMSMALRNSVEPPGSPEDFPMAEGEFSRWMPGLIGKLDASKTGTLFRLPGEPSPKDRQLLEYLDFGVAFARSEDGRWTVKKMREKPPGSWPPYGKPPSPPDP